MAKGRKRRNRRKQRRLGQWMRERLEEASYYYVLGGRSQALEMLKEIAEELENYPPPESFRNV